MSEVKTRKRSIVKFQGQSKGLLTIRRDSFYGRHKIRHEPLWHHYRRTPLESVQWLAGSLSHRLDKAVTIITLMPPRRKRSTATSSVPGRDTSQARKRVKTERSIWNNQDDWDQLVEDSALSTSSISTRRPVIRGMQSLTRSCAESAGRGFKALWEYGQEIRDGEVVTGPGKYWKIAWEGTSDHLKLLVRERVYRYWGSYLTPKMLSGVSYDTDPLFTVGYSACT